jgi:RNA polymerase sigma factor (sigma-70 family)
MDNYLQYESFLKYPRQRIVYKYKPQIIHEMSAAQKLEIGKTFEEESKRLFNFIRKRVKSDSDAEDILQDVFYQLVRVSDDATTIQKISAWLFQVARNRITDSYRKKSSLNFSEISKVKDEDEGSIHFEDYIPDMNDLPDSVLTREMVWELLEESLGEIPVEQREVFEMHEFEGMSFKEISEVTGEQVNTLISRKRYAILYLREKLNDLYNEILEQ